MEETDLHLHLPPGFTLQTRSSSSDFSGKGKRKETMFQTGVEEVNTPNIRIKFRGEDVNPNQNLKPKSEVIEDEERVEGVFDNENTDSTVSFHSENKVYTLCKAPQLTENAIQDESILSVKNGLRSFLLRADPSDIPLIITQSNNIFSFLQAMHAGYRSFYYNVRSYIRHCLDWYLAEQKLKKSQQSQKLVSFYDQLVHRTIESKTAVSDIEYDIVKAKMYMAPLEARVQDMKEMLEKLEFELAERKAELANLEANKVQKMEVIAALDLELKATASNVENTRTRISDDIARRDKAKVCMDKARNQLEIM
ncbi:hypothetical protein M5689_009331 [Euphorbia peplus]|nr:hypothetical protein M5689_009331 [Euphorbia peplus]